MLRKRLITASALGPLILVSIWFMPSDVFAIAIGIVALIAGLELAELARVRNPVYQGIYLFGLVALMVALCEFAACTMAYWVQALIAVWWLLMTILLITTRQAIKPARQGYWILIPGSAILVTAWLAMVQVHLHHENGPALIVFLCVLTWMADSSAFFAGKFWKRQWASPRPLSPVVSPGKTWAGLYGAMLGASLCALGLWLSGWIQTSLAYSITLCILVSLLSVGGDLWESMVKRRVGAKDSGSLLPGHGGMLDRIDSMLASAPVFAFGLHTLEMHL